MLASDASPGGGGVVHTEGTPEEMKGLVEHVSVKGGNVAPLHAAGLAEVEGSHDEVGPYGPLWGGRKEKPCLRKNIEDDDEDALRGAFRIVLERAGIEGTPPVYDIVEVGGREGKVRGCVRMRGGTRMPRLVWTR